MMFGNMLGGPKIKDLDVMFFMSPTCPWCKKMAAVMEKGNTLKDVMVVDVSKEDGQELAKKYGAASRGVPSFISRNGKGIQKEKILATLKLRMIGFCP